MKSQRFRRPGFLLAVLVLVALLGIGCATPGRVSDQPEVIPPPEIRTPTQEESEAAAEQAAQQEAERRAAAEQAAAASMANARIERERERRAASEAEARAAYEASQRAERQAAERAASAAAVAAARDRELESRQATSRRAEQESERQAAEQAARQAAAQARIRAEQQLEREAAEQAASEAAAVASPPHAGSILALGHWIMLGAGILFLVGSQVTSIAVPNPTASQDDAFRMFRGMAGAMLAVPIMALTGGALTIESTSVAGLGIQGGGAIVVFLIVFLYPKLPNSTGNAPP